MNLQISNTFELITNPFLDVKSIVMDYITSYLLKLQKIIVSLDSEFHGDKMILGILSNVYP
jgi:hypothetical protein